MELHVALHCEFARVYQLKITGMKELTYVTRVKQQQRRHVGSEALTVVTIRL
jgi:hypothetical protein